MGRQTFFVFNMALVMNSLPEIFQVATANRSYHGFRRHLDGYENPMANNFFPKLNFPKFVNRNVEILGGRLYSPSLKGCSLTRRRSVNFYNFPYICL